MSQRPKVRGPHRSQACGTHRPDREIHVTKSEICVDSEAFRADGAEKVEGVLQPLCTNAWSAPTAQEKKILADVATRALWRGPWLGDRRCPNQFYETVKDSNNSCPASLTRGWWSASRSATTKIGGEM
jgi:hypothetical protein